MITDKARQTTRLIDALARDVPSVAPLRRPEVRLAGWLVIAAGALAVGVAMTGARRDLLDAAWTGAFSRRAALMAGAGIAAAAWAFALSVPRSDRVTAWRWLPVAALAAWSGGLAIESLGALARPVFHISCLLKTLAFAAVPAASLVWMLRQAAPIDRTWTALLAGIAGGTLGALAAQLACGIDAAPHHLFSHAAPAIAAAAGTALLARPLLRWDRLWQPSLCA